MDEDTIRRGQAADRLLKDNTAMEAFTAVIEDAQDEWLRSRPDDVEGRESCFRMVRAVKLLVAKLEAWRTNAQVEQSNAEAKQRDDRGQAAFH